MDESMQDHVLVFNLCQIIIMFHGKANNESSFSKC